jgi:hypothetical protein
MKNSKMVTEKTHVFGSRDYPKHEVNLYHGTA